MMPLEVWLFLSTPSVRRATALTDYKTQQTKFLSTPSVRRATEPVRLKNFWGIFLSTPSVRRATLRAVESTAKI